MSAISNKRDGTKALSITFKSGNVRRKVFAVKDTTTTIWTSQKKFTAIHATSSNREKKIGYFEIYRPGVTKKRGGGSKFVVTVLTNEQFVIRITFQLMTGS